MTDTAADLATIRQKLAEADAAHAQLGQALTAAVAALPAEPDPSPPAAANPFRLPGADLGPLPFLLGLSMGWTKAQAQGWTKAVGRAPLCCSGGSHSAGRTASWDAVCGGPMPGAIAPGSQLDIAGHSTNLSDAFDVIPPGPGLIVATWRTVPDNIKASDYPDLAAGKCDDYAYRMGWNAWLLMKGRGYGGAQLVVRADKEYNGGGYGVTEQNAPQRAKWLGRWTHQFNQGYLDAGADDRPRHVLGLARRDQMGPLEAHVPALAGTVMVDAIDVSMHPPASGLSAYAGKPLAQQVQAVREWICGAHGGPCYAPDHDDPSLSALATAKAHGILISNFETSPRDDGKLACPISAAAWQAMFDFWRENAAMVGGVGVYNDTALDPKGSPAPGWAAGVDALVRLARGG